MKPTLACRRSAALAVLLLLAPSAARAQAAPPPAPARVATSQAKADKAYWGQYAPGLTSKPQGTWSVPACRPGALSAASRTAQTRAINYMRALVGVPAVRTNVARLNEQAQAAALVMAANGQLSHAVPPTWKCYSVAAAGGAATSDLGLYEPKPSNSAWIKLYMDDDGAGNEAVGHRRWLLDPSITAMGIGAATNPGGWSGSAIKVIGVPTDASAMGPTWVGWPAKGYFPNTLAPQRWSLTSGYATASFARATVSVRHDGKRVGVTPLTPVVGMGRPTLVWTMPNGYARTGSYQVTVDGVLGVPAAHSSTTYTVKLFKPVRPR